MAQQAQSSSTKKNRSTGALIPPPAAAEVSSVAPAKSVDVTEEQIAARAFEKYEARGSVHGFDRQDWEAAAGELTSKIG